MEHTLRLARLDLRHVVFEDLVTLELCEQRRLFWRVNNCGLVSNVVCPLVDSDLGLEPSLQVLLADQIDFGQPLRMDVFRTRDVDDRLPVLG